MFRKWLRLSPDDGGGGGNGASEDPLAGTRMRAVVLDPDDPRKMLQQIRDSFADVADDIDKRSRDHRQEMATQERGVQDKFNAAMARLDLIEQDQIKKRLAGRVMPHFEPLSRNVEVDSALRTYGGGDELQNFQQACDDYMIVNAFSRAAEQYGNAGAAGWVSTDHKRYLADSRLDALKAMIQAGQEAGIGAARTTSIDTLTAGQGLEWVPVGFTADLWTKYILALRLGSLFDRFTIPQRVGNYTWPVQTEDPTAYIAGQTVDFTWGPTSIGSNLGTTNRTFTPKVFAVRVHMSREFEEDAVFPVAPWLRGRMGIALAVGWERAIISGDTSTVHMDFDVCVTTAPQDVRRAFDGLRKMASTGFVRARVNLIGTSLTQTQIAKLGAKMGIWSASVEDNVFIAGVNGAWQMLDMTGVRTITDYGSMATTVRGEIGQYLGRPVTVTGWMPDTTGGVVASTGNIFTQILMVNRAPILIGEKRGTTIDTWFNPFTQQLGIVATVRGDLKCLPPYDATGNTVVGDIYNLTLW